MSAREADAANVRIPPPLTCLAVVAAGVLLQLFVYPLKLTLQIGARIAAGGAAGGVGLLLLGAAFLAFRRTGQNPKPWSPTPEFIATGVYRWTRNPMYVGLALLQAALAFALANGWLLVLVPATLILLNRTAIRHEEVYLERKFGETYAAYKRSVRRWL